MLRINVKKIWQFLDENLLSQKAFSVGAKLSPTTLSKILRTGEVKTYTILVKLSFFMTCPLDRLIEN